MSQTISPIDLSTEIQMKTGDAVNQTIWRNAWQKVQTSVNAVISALNGGDTPAVGKFYVNGTETAPVDGIVALPCYGQEGYPTGGYILSGTLNGKVVIGTAEAQPEDDTHVIIENLTILSSADDNAGIEYISASQSMQVTLVGKNIIICSHEAAMASQQKACLYSENNMIVQGNGYLSVRNLGGHGIKASELRISGNPHIYAEAIHDGIHGNSKLVIDGGIFCINRANDAFGTGTTGSISVFGGKFYAYNIAQKVFDSKEEGFWYVHFLTFDEYDNITTDVTMENIFGNITKVDPKLYFGGSATEPTGSVKCYSDAEMTLNETEIEPVDGVYSLTTKYAKVRGYVEGTIKATVQSTDIDLAAFVTGNIQYLPTSKKMQINVEKESIAITSDIYSFSNVAVEVKGGSHLLIRDNLGGDEVTINDSKGTIIALSTLQAKDLYIGTQASADANKFFQGALQVSEIKTILNSKGVKGTIHVLDTNMTGCVSVDKMQIAGNADLDHSKRFFYHESKGIVLNGKPTRESDEYIEI